MAAHMMLLERVPSFRASQMRLEGATARRRESGVDLKRSRIVTIKTVVNVVYKTDGAEYLRRPNQKPDRGDE